MSTSNPGTVASAADAAPIPQFVCMKWGRKYPASDVNRLYRSLARVTRSPFRFYCLTDDATGLDPSIAHLPIPELPTSADGPERGWRKLALFSPELQEIRGATLFLDLDVVIVDSLLPFFDHDYSFSIIKDYKRLRYRNRWTGNSSVFFYNAGADYGVYAYLRLLGPTLRKHYRNEQEFLSDCMRQRNVLRYWPKHWCPSYKYHCIPSLPLSLWRAPQPPSGARIIVFHGHPKPDEALIGRGAKWYRPVRPAPWLQSLLNP